MVDVAINSKRRAIVITSCILYKYKKYWRQFGSLNDWNPLHLSRPFHAPRAVTVLMIAEQEQDNPPWRIHSFFI
jgi:hypothetical protein